MFCPWLPVYGECPSHFSARIERIRIEIQGVARARLSCRAGVYEFHPWGFRVSRFYIHRISRLFSCRHIEILDILVERESAGPCPVVSPGIADFPCWMTVHSREEPAVSDNVALDMAYSCV